LPTTAEWFKGFPMEEGLYNVDQEISVGAWASMID
jgi:hypothetical protein